MKIGEHEISETDLFFEVTGVESCAQASIYATKARGRVMLVDMGFSIQTQPLGAAALREVNLCGVSRYARMALS
jgi:L-iditol 2-dehydrogenase